MASSKWTATKVIGFMAWLAVLLIAIALCLGQFIPVLSVLAKIAQALAYVVAACVGFFYANSRGGSKRTAYLICWAIGALVILVVFVLGLVL